MKTVAVIQARMGSTRLPGKVLAPLVGRPLLWHVVHRLRRCACVDEIVIATSTCEADDALEAFAQKLGVRVVRGSEDDVLARFWKATVETDADLVVRVCGDSPLIDPATIDAHVSALLHNDAEYVLGESGVPCIHEGFSTLRRSVLHRLFEEASDDPIAREHVTGYLKAHPSFARTLRVPIDEDYQFEARLSVDTPPDVLFIEAIYQHLGAAPGEADVREVVRLLRRQPELLTINQHVRRKGLETEALRVLVRCDGGTDIGMGHVVRCGALAEELRETHSCAVAFATCHGPAGVGYLRRLGFRVEAGDESREPDWLAELASSLRADVLVLDVRTNLDRAVVDVLRREGRYVVVVDDGSDRRLSADLSVFPPVPQVAQLDWSTALGKRLVGWEWVLLRRQFEKPPAESTAEPRRLLVTMGGSDPARLTAWVVRALERLEYALPITVVVGAGYTDGDNLAAVVAASRHVVQILRNVNDMRSVMERCEVAVVSFGVTAYELAAAGVPAVHVCLTNDHAVSSTAFGAAGLAVALGVHDRVADDLLATTVQRLLDDPERRGVMGARARATIDGLGARRLAAKIVEEARCQ
ncbi:cytidylyltransferase domain-containing protein [Planctomycetota bacterium]